MHEPSTEDYQSMCAVETLAEETQHCVKVPPSEKSLLPYKMESFVLC